MKPQKALGAIRRHAWFAASASVAVIFFAWVQTGGSFDLLSPESYCTFYEEQARSLLRGRLDVPEASISGEAFIVDGKFYGYFGVTPALLRLPLLALPGEPGRWSRPILLVAFAASLLFAYRVLLHVGHLCGRGDLAARPWVVCPFILGAGPGSTLFFLSSRAFIYHEAIGVGAAFALASAFHTMRLVDRAAASDAWKALACGILALHARPPQGLFALSFLLLGALMLAWPFRAGGRAAPGAVRPVPLAAACVAAMLTLNAVSYLKFGTVDPHPLRYAVQYTPERRAAVDDRTFHWQNIPFNTDEYLTGANFELRRQFPFLVIGRRHRGDSQSLFPAAKMDLEEPTLSLPLGMPYLFTAALAGLAYGLFAERRLRRTYTLLSLSILPTTAFLFSAIVVSQRFTADFCPFLACAAASGWGVLEPGGRLLRRCSRATVAALVAASIAVNFLAAVAYQGEGVWGTPTATVERYQRWKNRINAFLGS